MDMLNNQITPYDNYQNLTSKYKADFINEVTYGMEHVINGKQLLTLTRVLDSTLQKYELFIDENIGKDEDYEETNNTLLNVFLKTKELEGLTENTLDYYSHNLKKYLTTVNYSITEVTAEDLRRYLVYYKESGNCNMTTMDNIRRTLSSFFQWLTDEGYLLKNPMKRVKKIKQPKRLKHPFSEEDVEKLRGVITNQTCHTDYDELQRSRDLAIFELLLSSGIRVSELCGLMKEDINFKDNSFHVIGKGNKERECYFNEKAKLRMLEYLELRGDDDVPALFVSKSSKMTSKGIQKWGVARRLRAYGKKAGVTPSNPHRFRHTFATHMLHRGMQLEKIQKLLGHEKMETTLVYAEIAQADVKHDYQKYSN